MELNRSVRTDELFLNIPEIIKPLFESSVYPWEMLPLLREFLTGLIREGIEGYTLFSPGVLVGRNVRIYPSATIEGPTVIGHNSEIRPGAFVRGSAFFGEGCVIGNSSEIKNSILLDGVQIPHYNYIGDSVLGKKAHTGAGTICSNLKSDGKAVTVHGDCSYQTGLRKLGGILADGADVGCGTVINPGTVIGRNTRVYPLISLRGVYPHDSIVKATNIVVRQE